MLITRVNRCRLPLVALLFAAGALMSLSAAETPESQPAPAAADEQVAPAIPANQPDMEPLPPAVTNAPASDKLAVEEVAAAPDIYEEIVLLTEAMLLLRRNYVREVDYREIVYSAIHGMLSNLDPHSAFLEPRESDDLKEDAEARFVGIGIEVELRHGLPVVIAPIEDSPAAAAGLRSRDIITAINGERCYGLGLDKITSRLRGKLGTSVTVTIRREGHDPFEITLQREQIKLASVKGIRVIPGSRIGYLRIKQFSEPTGAELAEGLATLLTNELCGLVLDLRDNPGGLFEQALAVAVQFLPDKEVIVTTRGRRTKRPLEVFHAGGERQKIDLPLAILINRNTASASEIVTGALQDHGRAIVIGETSFGKASVQKVIPLDTREGCSLKITTAHYYTPDGRLIDGIGIEPDIKVSLPPSQWHKVLQQRAVKENPTAYTADEEQKYADVVDTQLQRAVDLLTGIEVFRSRPQEKSRR